MPSSGRCASRRVRCCVSSFVEPIPDNEAPHNRTKEENIMRRLAFLVAVSALPLVAVACGDDDHGAGHNSDMPMGTDQMPMGDMPMDQGDMPMGDMPMDQGDMPMGDMPMGDMPVGDMPAHGDHRANSPVAPDARRIDMTGDDFRFTPSMMTARQGENIGIMLRAEDLEHDLVIDEFDAHVYAGPGQTAAGGFTASRSGTFTFYCSVPGHREAGMEGTIVVE
jgi:plastocyanin